MITVVVKYSCGCLYTKEYGIMKYCASYRCDMRAGAEPIKQYRADVDLVIRPISEEDNDGIDG